ncbi:MAG: VWA domain-containing protein, partial [Nitratireductor sp.]
MAKDKLDILRTARTPKPDAAARDRALSAALTSFDENFATAPQGSADRRRQSSGTQKIWSRLMDRKFLSTPVIASLLALPVAGYATYYLMNDGPFALRQDTAVQET